MQGKTKTYDLTTGGILSKLLLVALPIMGTQLMQMTYNLVDMFWLGRVGSDAVAASGTAGMFMWLSSGLMLIGRMGAEIGVAQSLGRTDHEGAEHYARNSIYISLVLGALFGLAMIVFRAPLVGFFNIQEQNVVMDSRNYLAIVGAAIPFTYLSSAISGTFTAAGNSRTPFIANASGLVLNMLLDPVLIFVANMGVIGAALATILAQIFVAVLLSIAIKKAKSRPFAEFRVFRKPSFTHIKSMLKWSVPVGLESILFTVLSMITSRLVAIYGAGALATTRVGSQIESLSWLIGGGYASAVTAFVGQNYGAGQRSRISQCMKLSVAVMLCWGVVVTAMLYFAGSSIFLLFLPEPDLLAYATPYLQIMAYSQIAMCLEGVASGAFRGMGHTSQPAIASIISNISRVVIAYLLSRTALGINGIFWGITISTIIRGVWICTWYWLDSHKAVRKEATA